MSSIIKPIQNERENAIIFTKICLIQFKTKIKLQIEKNSINYQLIFLPLAFHKIINILTSRNEGRVEIIELRVFNADNE